mgnify:CR=1 FL=1
MVCHSHQHFLQTLVVKLVNVHHQVSVVVNQAQLHVHPLHFCLSDDVGQFNVLYLQIVYFEFPPMVLN